jgi:histidinol phosphatase-like enzyme
MTVPTDGRTRGIPAEIPSASKPDARTETTGRAPTIYLDLDTVLLATHPGRRGVELGVQADVAEGIDRLAEIAGKIVVLAYPSALDTRSRVTTELRLATLRDGVGRSIERVLIVTCVHRGAECDCAKPGIGLIRTSIEQFGIRRRGGWYIGADQEGVVAGRRAGLHTIRIGPLGVDHLSAVHRADYEARDLIDAANHILIEELAA